MNDPLTPEELAWSKIQLPPKKKTTKKKTAKRKSPRSARPKIEGKRTLPYRSLIVVDPGDQCASVISANLKMVSISGATQSIYLINRQINSAIESAGGPDKLLLVIEDQYLSNAWINPVTMDELYKRRHEWEFVAEMRGVAMVKVMPTSWQTVLKGSPIPLIVKKTKKGKGKKNTKERSIGLANRDYPGEYSWNEHEADAINLYTWYTRLQASEHGICAVG